MNWRLSRTSFFRLKVCLNIESREWYATAKITKALSGAAVIAMIARCFCRLDLPFRRHLHLHLKLLSSTPLSTGPRLVESQ